MSCTRGSNGPLKPAEGDVRSIVTERPDVRTVHGKAALGARESTRPTSNGVNFRYGEDNITGYSRSDDCRSDDVSIGRHPFSRPCASEVRKVCASRWVKLNRPRGAPVPVAAVAIVAAVRIIAAIGRSVLYLFITNLLFS